MTKKAIGTNGKAKRIGRPIAPVPQDMVDVLLLALYSGRTLTGVCEELDISLSLVSKWKSKDEAFRAAFACARVAGAAVMVDLAQDVADNANSENVQVARLRVDTLLKRAACFAPAQFGTKVQLGGDGGAPIKIAATGPTVPPTRDLLTGIRRLAGMAEELMPDDEE